MTVLAAVYFAMNGAAPPLQRSPRWLLWLRWPAWEGCLCRSARRSAYHFPGIGMQPGFWTSGRFHYRFYGGLCFQFFSWAWALDSLADAGLGPCRSLRRLAFSGKDTFPLAFYLCGFFLGVYFWMDPQLLALVDFCLSADPPFFSGHYGDRNRFRFYACPLQRFFYDVSGSGSGHYFAALQTKAFFLFPA